MWKKRTNIDYIEFLVSSIIHSESHMVLMSTVKHTEHYKIQLAQKAHLSSYIKQIYYKI